MKKALTILLSLVMLCSLIACSNTDDTTQTTGQVAAKTFQKFGLSITLTEDFKEETIQGYTSVYTTDNVAVFTLREGFDLMQGFKDYTLQEYAELVRKNNISRNPSKITTEAGLTVFEYEFKYEDQNQTYQYFTVCYKGPDAFWMVQMSAPAEEYDTLRADFVTWAKSVKIEEKA